jgi:hypothetical protein
MKREKEKTARRCTNVRHVAETEIEGIMKKIRPWLWRDATDESHSTEEDMKLQ